MENRMSRRNVLKIAGGAALATAGQALAQPGAMSTSAPATTASDKGLPVWPAPWKPGDTGYVCTPCSNAGWSANPQQRAVERAEREKQVAAAVEALGLKLVLSEQFDQAKTLHAFQRSRQVGLGAA